MTTETMSADHPLAVRRRALFDRIIALPETELPVVEATVGRAEAGIPATPGAQRVVAGATITERPDLAYATKLAGGPVTEQAPAPDHPAELAKLGGARR
jgi:hypothetical protein